MRASLLCLVLFVSLAAVAATRTTALNAAQDSAWAPRVQGLPTPAAAASGQPQLSVSTRGALVSWVERGGTRATLKFAERTADGWTPARTVAAGDDWFVNWADVPSVLRLSNGTLVAHWLQKSGPGTYAYDVRLSRSVDDGHTWSPGVTPHSDGTATEHGFASLFEMPGQGLGLVWLDGRAMASTPAVGAKTSTPPTTAANPASAGASHDAHGASTGTMSVRYGAFDPAWRQTAESAVDLRVCECCPTAAAVTSDGPIVAFRNRGDDETRDIHVSRLEGGVWTEPRAVHNDGWKINGCPVNGPMLSARGRAVAVAWFSVRDEVGHAYVAFSSDAGRTFGTPIRVDDEASLGRVDIELLADGSAVATWIERGAGGAQFSMRRVIAGGKPTARVVVADIDGARASGFPRIALAGNELLFAWTESKDGALRVRTARADAPPVNTAGPR